MRLRTIKTTKKIDMRRDKRPALFKLLLVLVFAFASLPLNTVSAIDQTFYSNNDILYYDPDGGCLEAIQAGGGCGNSNFTAATYNILQGEHHASSCGGKGDKGCMTERSRKQANVILGKDGGNPLDIIGLQEVSAFQYGELKRFLPGYDSIPANTKRLSNVQDGSVAIFWNKEKFKMVDSGKHDMMLNTPSNMRTGSRENKGIGTTPWVALQATNGMKVYVMSVHWPRPNYAVPIGSETQNEAFNRHLRTGVELARDWVQSETSDGVALFMGDFNDGSGTTSEARRITYCGLTKNGLLQNTWDMARNKSPSKECPSLGKGLNGTIDQIYAAPKEGVAASNWRKITSASTNGASDHKPTAVNIKLTGTDCGSEGGDSAGPGSLDAFLQALAKQESGGNPTAANPGSSARGKYQYITGTWQARWTLYPPANKYATADKAPESVQDAVAYIEYAQKWKEFNGSIFKLAISHFYPAANSDPSLLDKHIGPASNPTPREYGNSVVDKVKNGYGSEIPLKYKQAPQFSKHLTAAVGGDTDFSGVGTSSSDPSAVCGDSGGNETIAEGGLTEEQAKKFMMNYGDNKNGDSAKHTYANWDNCNGGGSNCVTFSQFFLNKFTSEGQLHTMGNGVDVVNNLAAKGVPTGSKPKLYSVFSMPGAGGFGHTGVVLGIHGDTIIVGHASCGNSGIGKGDGTLEGGGAGFIRVGKINTTSPWYAGAIPHQFAYPRGLNVNKIQDYVNGKI